MFGEIASWVYAFGYLSGRAIAARDSSSIPGPAARFLTLFPLEKLTSIRSGISEKGKDVMLYTTRCPMTIKVNRLILCFGNEFWFSS